MFKPLISIVIINKNDPGIRDTLKACLAIHSTYSREIIVVDSSAGKLDYVAAEFPEVKWINFKPLATKRISIPEQRNVGVRAAEGEIIVFTDANCIPEEGWLNKLVAPITKENESIVAGATYSRGKKTNHDDAYIENEDNQYISECPTINLAFTRSLYDKVGGFDESFEYGSDVDFSWRVIDAGYKVRYEPKALITHDWGDAKQELKRSYLYGKGRAKLNLKHKKILNLLTTDITALVYPIYIIGLPLTIWWHPYPLLILIPIIKNINKRPVATIVDHIVYGLGVLYEVFISPIKRTLKPNLGKK
jgi:GT2 family glycosyltransferase